jgi:hypothetical protein
MNIYFILKISSSATGHEKRFKQSNMVQIKNISGKKDGKLKICSKKEEKLSRNAQKTIYLHYYTVLHCEAYTVSTT